MPSTAWVRRNHLRTGVGRFRSSLHKWDKWGLALSATCESGAEEQTTDHVVLHCPIHRPSFGAGLWSRNSNFSLRLQAYQIFGSSSRTTWSIENQKPLYCLYNSLSSTNCVFGFLNYTKLHKLCLWNRNPNFRLLLHHLKVFGSRHPKFLGLRLLSHAMDCRA